MSEEKKILVTRSSMPPMEEYIEEIRELWETRWLTNMGIKHQKLEEGLRDYLGVKEISLMTNGHMALELAVQAMNLSGEVITTPFTFASTTHAIVRNGLKPVFCDVNPEDYTIDVGKIEGLVTDKTVAILPVHVYGNICDVDEIDRIAKKYGLKVIYDAAHAFGEKYRGVGVGNFGDASIYSFHATKVYNTIEGGAVCYSDAEYGLDLYRLKNFGIRNEECVDFVGANAKMNEFQAAMGLCNLKYIDMEIEKRKEVAERYRELLSGIPGLILSKSQKDVISNYSYFPVIFEEKEFGVTRDDVYNELAKHNIFSRKYFYPLTNNFDCYKGMFELNATPVASHISNHVLTLPIYAGLSINDVDIISGIIKDMKNS